MPSWVEESYPHTVSILKHVLGEKYSEIEPYLHVYDGTPESVKPVGKYITIYYVGRTADWLMIRTEGADDIVTANLKGKGVPALLFRKFKARLLRDCVQTLRKQWKAHRDKIKSINVYGGDYDFLAQCSISPGTESGKGVMMKRCMKCPVDVLMGAVSGKTEYNLASRVIGDTSYALSSKTQRMTGTSVEEVTHTTYIPVLGSADEEKTGAVFYEEMVPPNTLFVGKVALFMVSPPEFLYVLYHMTKTMRLGARQNTRGVVEIEPVTIIGDIFEAGSAYSVAEHTYGLKDKGAVRKAILDYAKGKTTAYGKLVELTPAVLEKVRKVAILSEPLAVELWKNSANFVEGVMNYIKKGKKQKK